MPSHNEAMPSKIDDYDKLVLARKSCDACVGLTNPARCANGVFDSSEIGPWTRWQGNLDASVMVIAQDWGDIATFQKQDGIEWDNSETNKVLQKLLTIIGIHIDPPSRSTGRGQLFFTNAILCLKKGGAQAAVDSHWFHNCGTRFLRPQIEIVKPTVVICLGQRSYETVLRAYDLKPLAFRQAVNGHRPIVLSNGVSVFAVYHCSRRILNTHRNMRQQQRDWQLIGTWVRAHRAAI